MTQDSLVRGLYRFQQRIGMTASEFRAVCLFAGLLLTGSVAEHVRQRLTSIDPEVYAATDAYFHERAAAAGLVTGEPAARSEPAPPAIVPVTGDTSDVADPIRKSGRDPGSTLTPGAAGRPATVDVNLADEEQLQALPGIGPALARRIIDFRTRNGDFRYVEDLLMIRGIGERTLERLAPYVTVDGTLLPDDTVDGL